MTRRSWAIAGLLVAALAIGGWVLGYDDATEPGTAVLGGYRDRVFLLNLAASYGALVALCLAWIRPRRETYWRLVVLHAGMLVAFVLVEATAMVGVLDFSALGWRRGPFATGAAGTRRTPAGLRWSGTMSPDLVDVLGVSAPAMSVSIETDRFGLRNPRDKLDPAVVCLGDSVLVAGLVPVEQTVTELLERSLRVPVLNVSEVASAPQEELARFESTGIEPAGRLVVHFLFEGNDLADIARWRSAQRSSTSWPESGLLKNLLERLHRPKRTAGRRRAGRYRAGGVTAEVHFLYDAETIGAHRDQWPELLTTIRDARTRLTAAGATYAVVLVPCTLTVLHACCEWPEGSELAASDRAQSVWRPAAERFCAEEQIAFFDLTPPLREAAARGELPYFEADTHLNAKGHEVMAAALAPWIEGLRRR